MLTLKSTLFNDLKDPLSYTKTCGFHLGPFVPDNVRAFGKRVYFYRGRMEASCTTPECRVLSTRLNCHETSADHTLSVLLPEDWVSETMNSLRDAMQLVYADAECLPLSTASVLDADAFWSACRKPFANNVLTLETPSRRRRAKTYINMFNGVHEITGNCSLHRGGSVQVSVRFTVSEGDVVSDGFGIRAEFFSGIRVIRVGGEVPKIKAPWDWSDISFDDLTIPLRGPFHVKTPVLTVVNVDGPTLSLDVNRHQEFKTALEDFHHLAQTPFEDTWSVEHHGRKTPTIGSTVMGTVEPMRNNGDITWHSRKVFVRPPRLELVAQNQKNEEQLQAREEESKASGRKRDFDTSGNFSDVQTKRQCTPHETYDHMEVHDMTTAHSNI